jgi:molybdopterin-guanine dinucleotide biosynthesis protein A
LSESASGGKAAAGFVLAGGESRRMGRDKALVEFAGEPLVARAIGILREAGLEARIAGARATLDAFAPVVADAEPGRGPLGGICAALAACTEPRAVFLPVDLPLLPASLITYLVHRTEVTQSAVTLASAGGFAQTFPAVLDVAVLPALEAELGAGRSGAFAALHAAAAVVGRRVQTVAVEYVAQSGQAEHSCGLPAALWFLNVNSPVELRRAEVLVGRAASVI